MNPYPTASGLDSPPIVTPHYGASYPEQSNDLENARRTRCATGFGFVMTLHGILNGIIILALVCVLIAAGVSDPDRAREADDLGGYSNVKISAYNTRNAVLAFAVIGIILVLVDTILHVTTLINKLPASFDTIFIIVMFVFAGVLLIVGCCAAAWEKKMNDTVGSFGRYRRRGSAGAAAFFLFIAMLATFTNFLLRLMRSNGPALNLRKTTGSSS